MKNVLALTFRSHLFISIPPYYSSTMSQFVSDLVSNPRFQLAATAIASGATVAALILGYQAFEQEERLSELKNSIPSLKDDVKVSSSVLHPC